MQLIIVRQLNLIYKNSSLQTQILLHLATKELLGLIREADIVVGGVGFIVPACIAYGTRLFCILGGNGMYNAPEKITYHKMDLSRVYFARPDNFCPCASAQHQCDKRITDLKGKFDAFIGRNLQG